MATHKRSEPPRKVVPPKGSTGPSAGPRPTLVTPTRHAPVSRETTPPPRRQPGSELAPEPLPDRQLFGMIIVLGCALLVAGALCLFAYTMLTGHLPF